MCLSVFVRTNLGFGVGPQPGQDAIASQLSDLGIQFVSEDDCEGHALLRLISRIAKHQTL